jgi:hypothetical protein
LSRSNGEAPQILVFVNNEPREASGEQRGYPLLFANKSEGRRNHFLKVNESIRFEGFAVAVKNLNICFGKTRSVFAAIDAAAKAGKSGRNPT